QMAPYGLVGTLFARGTANSAALIALVESGAFSKLPGLRIVVTALALGGLAVAASLSSQSLLPSGTIDVMRKHVFIDTMWAQPATLRASIDLLGAGHVIAGSDWPIAEGPFAEGLTDAMRHANLSDQEQKAIAAGNCVSLLKL